MIVHFFRSVLDSASQFFGRRPVYVDEHSPDQASVALDRVEDLKLVETIKDLDKDEAMVKITDRFEKVKMDLRSRLEHSQADLSTDTAAKTRLEEEMRKLLDRVDAVERQFEQAYDTFSDKTERSAILARTETTFNLWVEAYAGPEGRADISSMDVLLPQIDALSAMRAPEGLEKNDETDPEKRARIVTFLSGIADKVATIRSGMGVAGSAGLSDRQREMIRQATVVPILDLWNKLNEEKKIAATDEDRAKIQGLTALVEVQFESIKRELAGLGIDAYRKQDAVAGAGYETVNDDNVEEFYKGSPWAYVFKLIMKMFGVQMVVDSNGVIAGFGADDPTVMVSHLEQMRDAEKDRVDKSNWTVGLREQVTLLDTKRSVWEAFLPKTAEVATVKSFDAVLRRIKNDFDGRLGQMRQTLVDGKMAADPDAFLSGRVKMLFDSGCRLVPEGGVDRWDGEQDKSMTLEVYFAWLTREAEAEKVRTDSALAEKDNVPDKAPEVAKAPEVKSEFPSFEAQAEMYRQALESGPPFDRVWLEKLLVPFDKFCRIAGLGDVTVEQIREAEFDGFEQLEIGGKEIELKPSEGPYGALPHMNIPMIGGILQSFDIYGSLRSMQQVVRYAAEGKQNLKLSELRKYVYSPEYLADWHRGEFLGVLNGHGIDDPKEYLNDTSYAGRLELWMEQQNIVPSPGTQLTPLDWARNINMLISSDEWPNREQEVKVLFALRFLTRIREVPENGQIPLAEYLKQLRETSVEKDMTGTIGSLVPQKDKGNSLRGLINDQQQLEIKKEYKIGVFPADYDISVLQFLFFHKLNDTEGADTDALFFNKNNPSENHTTLPWSKGRHVMAALLEKYNRWNDRSTLPDVLYNDDSGLIDDILTFQSGGETYKISPMTWSKLEQLDALAKSNSTFSMLMRMDSDLPLFDLLDYMLLPRAQRPVV